MKTPHTITGLGLTMGAAVTATVAPALAATALAALALGVFLAACVYVSNRRGM